MNVIDWANGLGAEWARQIATASLGGAVAAGVAWAVTRKLRGLSPTARVWIWRAVIAKFLVALVWVSPVTFHVPAAMFPVEQGPSSTQAASLDPVAAVKDSAPDLEFEGRTLAPAAEASARLELKGALFLIWLGMAAAFALGIAASAWRQRRKFGQLPRVQSDEILRRFKAICSRLGLKRAPDLRWASALDARCPCAVGILRPMVVVPEGFFNEPGAELVLAHELGHIRERHLAWALPSLGGLAVFFFHPVYWLAHRELMLAQEMEADSAALALEGTAPRTYGEALLKWLRPGTPAHGATLGIARVAESQRSLTRRVLVMNQISKKIGFRLVAGFALVAVLGILPWKLSPRLSREIAPAAVADGNSFAAKCPDVEKCIKAVSEITGEKYVFNDDVKGKIGASDNVELNKENANLLLTKVLNLNGFTRVPLSDGTFQVMKQRDARDTLLPKIWTNAEAKAEFPDSWDLYTMVYVTKHFEMANEMARTARSFLPAHARVIAVEVNGHVMVTAAAPELKNVYQLFKDMDKKPTAQMLSKWAKRDAEASHRQVENRREVEIRREGKDGKEVRIEKTVDRPSSASGT